MPHYHRKYTTTGHGYNTVSYRQTWRHVETILKDFCFWWQWFLFGTPPHHCGLHLAFPLFSWRVKASMNTTVRGKHWKCRIRDLENENITNWNTSNQTLYVSIYTHSKLCESVTWMCVPVLSTFVPGSKVILPIGYQGSIGHKSWQ